MEKKEIDNIIDKPLNSTKQLFEIRKTDNGLTLILNRNHPFFQRLYYCTSRITDAAELEKETFSQIVSSSFKEITCLIDLLFMGYAKAESMFLNPEEDFKELRYLWQSKTEKYIDSLIKNMKNAKGLI